MSFIEEHCTLRPLTKEVLLSVGDFSCRKESDIEKFFKEETTLYASELMGFSYGFIDNRNGHLVCAFCITCASVETDEMPKSMRNKLNRSIPHIKQRETYPAMLLAQLAIFDEYSDLHVGDELMGLIKVWILTVANLVAARYLIVDAVNSPKVIDFYSRNNFKMVFASEEEEKQFEGKTDKDILNTRFMLTDLKDIKL